MKNFLTLGVSSLLILTGCALELPKYPDKLKNFKLIEVRNEAISSNILSKVQNLEQLQSLAQSQEVVRCLKFNVVQINPYKFEFSGVGELKECHELSGFVAEDSQQLFNWIDDVFDWAKAKENCLKL
jgi:hypothetical protein